MRRIVLVLLLLLGVTLRLWNADTAYVHGDDNHTVSDAKAAKALPRGEAIRFLREHPRDHPRWIVDRAELTPWAASAAPRPGHPALQTYLLAPIIDVLGPNMEDGVRVVRITNTILSSLTILLLPAIVAGAGGSAGAGLLAAALYAVLPPIVVYDSIGNPEPLLELLVVVLVWLCVRPSHGLGRWVAAGVVTGLALNVELPGLIALILVPVYLRRLPERRLAAFAAWAAATVVVFVLFTSPAAYLEGLLRPGLPYRELRPNVVKTLARNVAMLADPSSYYWLSVARHSRPLASIFGKPHYIVTPGVLFLAAVGLVLMLGRRRTRMLLVLALPILLVLVLVPPSDALWRVLPIFPFVCAAAAYAFTSVRMPARLGLLMVVVALGIHPFLPQYIPASGGRIDFARVLLQNPTLRPPHRFHGPGDAQELTLHLGRTLQIPVLLQPGAWALGATGKGAFGVFIDGKPAKTISARPPHVQLQDGWLHTVDVTAFTVTEVESITLKRLGPK
jgi:hypothetical protein